MALSLGNRSVWSAARPVLAVEVPPQAATRTPIVPRTASGRTARSLPTKRSLIDPPFFPFLPQHEDCQNSSKYNYTSIVRGLLDPYLDASLASALARSTAAASSSPAAAVAVSKTAEAASLADINHPVSLH